MKVCFYMPVWKGNLDLAVSTAESLRKHESDTEIIFSYEELERSFDLEKYGHVFYGGERGWAGRRYARQMNELVTGNFDLIIKLDPDSYCLKQGAVNAILSNIEDCPVIGSTLILFNDFRLSLGGVVAMRADFIKELYKEPFYRCEDYTRSNLLTKLGLTSRSLKEIACHHKTENYSLHYACVVHPWIKRREE